MATSKAPLTRCSGTMSESQYLQWIRSALRSKSLRWKPRTDAIIAARRKYTGPNKMQKYECQCAICLDWFKQKDIAVDHYPKEAGSILSVADIGPFAERLFSEVDNLRILCNFCHRKHTLSSSKGITMEEAALEIKVNDVMKNKKEMLELFAKHSINSATITNDTKRKAALTEIFKKEL